MGPTGPTSSPILPFSFRGSALSSTESKLLMGTGGQRPRLCFLAAAALAALHLALAQRYLEARDARGGARRRSATCGRWSVGAGLSSRGRGVRGARRGGQIGKMEMGWTCGRNSGSGQHIASVDHMYAAVFSTSASRIPVDHRPEASRAAGLRPSPEQVDVHDSQWLILFPYPDTP